MAFLSVGFYISRFRYKVFIWAFLVIITIVAVEPAKELHNRDTIKNPGTELRSPPKLYIMTNDEELTAPIGDYKWHCDDIYKENHWGFTEWVRIGFPESGEYKLSSEAESVTLRFTDFPDEIEIRYWESVNCDWPSETGKKIKLNEENSFEITPGYYRIDSRWNNYGNVEYCFVVK